MTRAEARERLALRLGNRTDVTNGMLDNWLNAGLQDLTTRRVEIQELQGVGSLFASQVGIAHYARPATAFAIRHLYEATQGRVLDRFPGSFGEYLPAAAASTYDEPTQFIEWGDKLYLIPVPDVATYYYAPYTYNLATWNADVGAAPSIRSVWDRGILLLAEMIGFQEMGDEERAMSAMQEFETWLSQRDTPMRQIKRFTAPVRGIQPANATTRSPRTGV